MYSKNELKYVSKRNRQKTFVANNTINFFDFPKITDSKEELRKKHSFKFTKIVLFVGRIQKRKRLDVIINIFRDIKDMDTGLIIVGSNMPKAIEETIERMTNVIYLGPIYDKLKINEIFKCSDVFCIPGTNGLGINQAMYWGLPVLTMNVHHSPEIVYLKNGKNGYIAEDEIKLKEKIVEILNNPEELALLSSQATKTILEEASPLKMFQGFMRALQFLKAKQNNDQVA
ncbi:glycosyltransferase family 4 protein [Flagellimonas allohymeniacidonis]|uniref:glycosyltransferase family 4 protein n=1 Tax=Flagellimonas allohymeniacidonis TaxID=2517819 RepID=UPI0013EE870A|nr:glycosyltransferase family 4 protein [Allomuricauda hymeniacidonis]